MTSTERRLAAVELIVAIGDCLRDVCAARGGSVPAGEFYARLTALPGLGGMGAAEFNQLVATFEAIGVVTRVGHLLTWVGDPGQVVES